MARKKPLVYTSWDQIDAALEEMARNQIALDKIKVKMNEAQNKIKISAADQSKPHQERMSEIEKDIKEFVAAHKAELSGKSRKLNFGSIGYRYSSSVSLPRDKDKYDAIVAILKARDMTSCIIPGDPTIDKEQLKRYGEQVVREVGAGWKAGDSFFCEPDLEKIKSTV